MTETSKMPTPDENRDRIRKAADVTCGHLELYESAIKEFGITGQLMKAAEEANEFSAAVLRYWQYCEGNCGHRTPELERKYIDPMLEEFADIEIMLEQFRIMLVDSDLDMVERIKEEKLARLVKRIADR